jgi:polysaccharide biosynthesis/export protein
MIRRFLLYFLIFSMTSCVPYKDLVLFRQGDAPITNLEQISTLSKVDLTIQPNDILTITVSCYDPILAAPFNLIDSRQASNVDPNSPLVSYLVDSNGSIEYPVFGKIQVAKKTISQLRDTLTKRIKPYIKEPIINIRRVNFRVTVLGEVSKPSSFNVPSERITILEAIGMAGDLTPHSDRQRVIIVREENGKMTFGKVNLQSTDFFTSPYYYLRQNDVVYIDPKKNKTATVNDPASKYVSWGTAVFSAISTVVTVIILLKR